MWLANATICSPLCLDGIGTVLSERREMGGKFRSSYWFSVGLENRVRGSETHREQERRVTLLKVQTTALDQLGRAQISTLTDFKGGSFQSCLFMDVIMWRVSQKVNLNSACVFCYCASMFCDQNIESSYVSKPPGRALCECWGCLASPCSQIPSCLELWIILER